MTLITLAFLYLLGNALVVLFLMGANKGEHNPELDRDWPAPIRSK